MTITETTAEAWRRRTAQRGSVDFTAMYVAHDAFTRDLSRLSSAARQGRADTPEARATWAMFSRQLHGHHTAEDTSLWPKLRAKVTAPDEVAVLDAMEAEHAIIEPLLTRVDAVLGEGRQATLAAELDELAAALAAHLRHEEDAALPLVERRLGQDGWAAFGRDVRAAAGGIRAGAQYLPWVLDGAAEPARQAMLGILPPPVRVLYRRLWEPRYQRAPHLR